jgi:type I restriction enzyme S subunit
MPNDWPQFTTAELINSGALEIGDGYRAKNSEMSTQGLPFIRAGDVNGRVNTIGTDILSRASVQKAGPKISLPGDVVITTKGTVGRLAIVRSDDPMFVYSPQLCYWRSKDPERLHPAWLFYALQSDEFVHQMRWSAGQTDMAPYMSLTDQRTFFKLTVPPVPEQRAIAATLGALDDKIELNRKMNATLEAMARALFRDWFVDFGPTRAKAEGRAPYLSPDLWSLFPDRLDDEGKPEVWEVSTIGDEVRVVGGSTPSTKEPDFWDGGINWATPKDLSTLAAPVLLETSRSITAAGLAKISSGLLPVGTLLLSSRAPIGYLAIAEVPVAINQGFIGMICDNRVSNVFAWLWTLENMEAILAKANGSTFQEISKSNFRPLPVVVPSEPVLQAFDAIAKPLYERIVRNERESRTLAETRDLLLPRLMSGKLRVAEAARTVEAEP